MTDRETVQAAIDAFASGDPDLIVRYIDPEFVGEVPASMSAEPDNYVGHEGVRRYFSTFQDAIDDLQFDAQVIEEVGEWFIAHLHVTGQGRTSGIPVDLDAYAAAYMRDGKLLRMIGHPTHDEARATATRG